MTDDSWHRVRAIPTIRPDGKSSNIFVGMVQCDGKPEPALRIDDGPIALLPLEEVGADLLAAIRTTLLDWYERQQR